MPILSNPRHEQFAQALAKGKSATEAYEQAGYKPNEGNAGRLNRNEQVRARIQEIVARTSEKAEWSAADRLKSLKTIHDSQIEKDPRVAISAIAEANKMQGTIAAQKHQHSGHVGTYDLSRMTDEQLDKLESILGPLALAGGDTSGEGEAEG